MLLEEHDSWDFVENIVVELTESVLLAKHKKKMAKMKQVILDSVEDHFIPHIVEKAMGKDLFDAMSLYWSENVN
jgi:hypothetical protein